jgi:hypothetical protein
MIFYIHLGNPKAASAFLQDKFFNKIHNTYYAGTPFSKNLELIFNCKIFMKLKKNIFLHHRLLIIRRMELL